MRKILITTSLVFCQLQASAGPLSCSALFGTKKGFTDEMSSALHDLETLNEKQQLLERLTSGTNGRVTEIDKQDKIRQLRFDIEFGNWKKALKDIQGLSIELGKAYMKIKLPEARVLALRANAARTVAEDAELQQLELKRAHALRVIGLNVENFRDLKKTLDAYRTDPDAIKELAALEAAAPLLPSGKPDLPALLPAKVAYLKQAENVERHLGIEDSWLTRDPGLVAYLTKHAAAGVDPLSYIRPSIAQLEDLLHGRDTGLADSERKIALFARLDRDINAQRLDNFLRKTSDVVSDQSLRRLYQFVISKFSKGKIDPDTAKELAEKFGQAADDINAIENHYPGISLLKTSKSTVEDKFKFFMEMNSQFGSSKEGVPLFAATLARRADMLPVWKELKDYIQQNQSDFVMAPKLKLPDVMIRAEEARILGMLPSVLNPKGAATFRAAKAIVIAGVLTAVAGYYATGFFRSDDHDDKSHPAPAPTPIPGALVAPVPGVAPAAPAPGTPAPAPAAGQPAPAPVQPAPAAPAPDAQRPLPPVRPVPPSTSYLNNPNPK